MKAILIIALVCGTIFVSYSQGTTIVENEQKTQYENTSYLVVGSLVLKPGFNFNSASQGNFFARAYDNDPTAAPSQNRSFLRSEQVYIAGVTTDDQVIPLPVGSKSVSFSYFDGIGRPIQSLQMQASPGKSDLVQPVAYDVKQRPSISYLPYHSSGTTGAFRTSAVSEQGIFYASPPIGVTSDTKAYSNAVYEDSPLERVLAVSNIGNDFQQVYASSRAKVNTATDAVRRWDIVSGRPNSTGTYPANSLSVAETTDPAGHITRTFSDFAGRTVLVRTQSGSTTWFDTYYVYNNYGELLFVIPPQSSATFAPIKSYVDLWHFQYAYDDLGRQTGSKAPGAGWVYTIYDKWDRPVLTQDSVQRVNTEWTYVKYDIHNRPVIIGTITNGTAIATLRSQVAGSSAFRSEKRITTSPLGYTTNSSYPTNANEEGILSITYYDDYGFRTNTGWASGTGNSNGLYAFAAESGYFTLQDQNTAVKGLVTGSKSRRQGNNTDWINSVTYYDKYYQPIQSISTHQLQGTVKTSTLYAFSGEVQKTVNTYSYNGSSSTKVERRFTYDHAGRPLKVYHKIDTNAEVMLSHFQYNELGEATDIIHHSRNNGNTWLYKTGLKSTIQGWTDEMLYSYSNGDPVFRQKLDYNKASGTVNTPRLDGIITSNQWKHYGSGEPERVYNYTYDIPKRLTASTYRQKTGTTWDTGGRFNESHISYSANGNITALRRNRDNAGTAVQMDLLTYSYSGNQLTGVSDTAPAAHKAGGFNDGNSGTDYSYNGNGYLKEDKNKGITEITYTLQDLPSQVKFGSDTIKYTYSSGGGLMTVEYSGNGAFSLPTQQYVGELVFEDGVLTEIRHEYGRVLADAGNRYQYYLTDHLGNTRVVLQEDPADFTVLATFEPDNLETESMQFMDYGEAPHIASSLFDHTGTSETGYALRLTDGEIGPSRSVAVLPGDTVRMEVFGKYLDLRNKKTDPAFMALSLAMAAANPASPGIDGNLSSAASRISGTEQGLSGLLVGKETRNDAPPAYLNYLFFDKEMNYKYGGYTQMTEAAYEDGSNREHERLYQEVVAEEPGYFYIYLSNDGTEGGEAYFDDFTILTLESYIVQQTDYYPYGLIARNFVRTGEKETKELFQGKTYEELTGWYDFHARQYDAALGRWFGVDPQNQFASPYTGMGNNPVMMVDPDGEFVVTAMIVGALVFGSGNLAIQAHKGNINSWSDGFLAFGKGAAVGAAVGSGFGKLAVAKGWGIAAGAKSAVAAKTGLMANNTASLFGGGLNMVNSFDPEKGVGLHTLGHFAAGYIGTQVGIDDAVGGFFTGGILNAYTDMASGSIYNGYGMVQSFVGGGLSSLAGSSFSESVKYKWDLAGKSGKEQFAKYGLQNVASNFAYDKKQEFFKKPLAIHGAAFMVGGVGASLQGGIMGGKSSFDPLLNFTQRFGLSMLAYGAEYSSNYYFKTKMQQVKYGDFQKNKGASYGVKGFSYSWLYTWY